MLKSNFRLDPKLYPSHLVAQAQGVFSDFPILIQQDGNIEISSETSVENQQIFSEFANYVLALINETR